MDVAEDMLRPLTVWCSKSYIVRSPEWRAYDCEREKGHDGGCDNRLDQQRRIEYCQQLVGASEGV